MLWWWAAANADSLTCRTRHKKCDEQSESTHYSNSFISYILYIYRAEMRPVYKLRPRVRLSRCLARWDAGLCRCVCHCNNGVQFIAHPEHPVLSPFCSAWSCCPHAGL